MTKEFVTERLRLIDLDPDKAKSIAKEYGLKEDEVELIKKGVSSVKIETDKDERSVISFINTEDPDRDNEIVDPDGAILKYYNRVVPYGHDYRGLPMGKSMWIKRDKKNGKKGLLAKTIFLKRPAINEELYHMYTDDIAGTGPVLNSWSIGFIPLKWEDYNEDGEKLDKPGKRNTKVRRKYTKWELLEYSGVMIPSNRQALTLMVEKGLIKDGKLKKDIEDYIVEIEGSDGKVKLGDEAVGKIEDETKTEELTTCQSCSFTFDYSNEPEVSMGAVKCPKCSAVLNQEGQILTHKSVILKPEETDDAIRLPVKGEEGKHKNHKIRWITVSEEKGIKGLYCIDDKMIITYIFDKKKGWTLEKAKKWMKDNGKLISQVVDRWNEIMPPEKGDDVWEFLEELLELALAGKYTPPDKEIEESFIKGIVEETKEESKTEDPTKWIKELTEEVKALKEGRVLSGKNLKLVKDCKEQIDKVGELLGKLIVASEPPEPPKEESILPLIEDSKGKENITDINSLTKDDVPVIVEETLKGFLEAMSGQQKEMVNQRKEIQKIFDKSRGKVN